MTENEHLPDPENAPVDAQGGSAGLESVGGRPRKGHEDEPDNKPFAGDDDILAGHLDEP